MSNNRGGAVVSIAQQPRDDSKFDLRYLIRAMIRYQASDLHLRAGVPPLYRVNGKLIPAKLGELTSSRIEDIVFPILHEEHKTALQKKRQVDFSFKTESLGRFRCNFFYQKGTLAAVIRSVPMRVPSVESLGLPVRQLLEVIDKPRGIFLVTGATGSGKSTTLAAMIQTINEHQPKHVLTIEDPIEFEFRDVKATITQREVGQDVKSFDAALFAGLRQDPDVIVVGELRDPKTIQLALTAAETGHLVLSTLHTNDAKSAIDRLMGAVAPELKNQIRMQLATSLLGVLTQQLLEKKDGSGRALVYELMIASPAIQDAIRSDNLNRIPEIIGASRQLYGMQTFNHHLEQLVESRVISKEEALSASNAPDDLRVRLMGMKKEVGY